MSEAEVVIRDRRKADVANPLGGTLGQRNEFHYVSLFVDEKLDEHLAERKSFWLKKKELGEVTAKSEIPAMRELLNQV